MSVRFQQQLISIRERLNDLFNHRHDALYEKKGTFLGKNLLINGDKTVSQRGDFSTPFAPVSNTRYVDAYFPSFSPANVTVDYSHDVFDTDIGSKTISAIVTLTNGSPSSNFNNRSVIPDTYFLRDKIVTYTALVKSNAKATLTLRFDGTTFESSPHSGNGEFELLTVSARVPFSVATSTTQINIVPLNTGTTLGDYIVIGKEKLEQGDKFTGFDYVSFANNLIDCRNIMLPITSNYNYDVIGTFVATSTTEMQCELNLTPSETIYLIDNAGVYQMLGPSTGTITASSLQLHGSSSMEAGKIILTLSGTGFSVGEINIVRKNNNNNLIYLSDS